MLSIGSTVECFVATIKVFVSTELENSSSGISHAQEYKNTMLCLHCDCYSN